MASENTALLLSTSIVVFISGFALGIYSIRGYLLISPALVAERRANWTDPVESDEEDVDEQDSILDHAPNWTNGPEADRRDGLRLRKGAKDKDKKQAGEKGDEAKDDARKPVVDSGDECKLVLAVRTDLGMTKGKMAAQCCHATLACYKSLSRVAAKDPASAEASLLKRWERHGQAKIAVQVKSQQELLDLMSKARGLGVVAEVIADAGRTQIDPGSLTVLGVGPAGKGLVDQITGHLKLL